MHRRLEQWLTAPVRLRIVTLGGVMLLTGALIWGLIIQPGNQQLSQWRTKQASFTQSVRAEQRKIRSLEQAFATVEHNLPSLNHEVFSAIAIGDRPGVALVKWQPEGQYAELVLRSQWATTPALFGALSRTDARLTGFSLKPDDGALMFVLRLEPVNEK